jgi:hypothetical protein
MRATKGSAKKAQWIQRVKEKKQARRCSSSPSSFVPSSPVSRLGHVLLQAQAERVETPGGGEPAGAELEAEVLEGEGAHGRFRGGVVHFVFFVGLEVERREQRRRWLVCGGGKQLFFLRSSSSPSPFE